MDNNKMNTHEEFHGTFAILSSTDIEPYYSSDLQSEIYEQLSSTEDYNHSSPSTSLSSFTALPSLTNLSLASSGHISDGAIARILNRLPTLLACDLRSTAVGSESLQSALTNRHLTELNISNCLYVQSKPSISLSSLRFSTLSVLSLSNSIDVRLIGLTLPQLTSLNLSNCRHLTSIVLYTPALTSLNASGCLALTKIQFTVQNEYNRAFDVAKRLLQSFITAADRSIIANDTVRSNTQPNSIPLQSLNITLCRPILTSSCLELLKLCRQTLKSFKARSCVLLSDDCADELIFQCLQLIDADISGCKNISAARKSDLDEKIASKRKLPLTTIQSESSLIPSRICSTSMVM
jgi:hypothetical protein